MEGVLLVAHGSREQKTEITFNAIAEMTRAKVDIPIETAYLQFSENSVEAGLMKLMALGVTTVRLIPYFLFAGVHVTKSIEIAVSAFLNSHSGITITVQHVLGADSRLSEIILDRIQE